MFTDGIHRHAVVQFAALIAPCGLGRFDDGMQRHAVVQFAALIAPYGLIAVYAPIAAQGFAGWFWIECVVTPGV